MKIVVTGIKEIDKALTKLGSTLGNKVVRKAIRESLKPVAAAVKAKTPRRSGTLVRAVKVKSTKRSKTGFGAKVVIGEGNFKGSTFYGAMVEFGTKRQKAQHFMEEAFDATKNTARKAAIDGIKSGIDAAVREVAAKGKQ